MATSTSHVARPGLAFGLLALIGTATLATVAWNSWRAGGAATLPDHAATADSHAASEAAPPPTPAVGSLDPTDRREVLAPPMAPGDRTADDLGATTKAPDSNARPAKATVRGRVVDPRGTGISGVTVSVVQRQEVPVAFGLPRELTESKVDGVATDANGGFAVPLRDLGPFELVAVHDEHPEARHTGNAMTAAVDGVLLVLRDGGTIRGVVTGAPPDAGRLTVLARRTESGVEAAARSVGNAFVDVGDFVEGLGLSIGARQTPADDDGAFVLRGLEPGARYQVYATRTMPGALIPARCTERVDVREGAAGLQLRWRETSSLVVRIVDAETGKPLEDLDVSIGPVHRMQVLGMSMPIPMRQPVPQRHFPGGVIQIDGLGVDDGEQRKLSIEVRAAGHQPWSRDDLDAAPRGRLDLGVVQLLVAPVVRVVVTDIAGPVAGARVRLVSQEDAGDDAEPHRGNRSISFSTRVPANEAGAPERTPGLADRPTTTDAAGIAEVTAESDGTMGLVVESEKHAPWHGQPFALPMRGTVEQRAFLVGGGTIQVHARDGHGAPLANATIRRQADTSDDQATATTDAAGQRRFDRVAPGVHWLRLVEPSHDGPTRVGVDLGGPEGEDKGRRVEVADGQVVEVELIAPLRGSLRGVVTLDGQPLDRAEVRIGNIPASGDASDLTDEANALIASMLGGLMGSPVTAKTDVDGAFELKDVEAGPRRLLVSHKELAMPGCADITIVEGENVHDVALRSTTLRGRVLRTDGTPIEGASVKVSVDTATAEEAGAELEQAASMLGEFFDGTSQPANRTDAEGRFELRGVRPGVPLRVRASARLHVGSSVGAAPVPADGPRDDVEIRLAAAGRVRIKANVDGAMSVEATWAGDGPAPPGATSSRDSLLKSGRATLDGLPPGRWRFRLDGAGDLETHPRERTILVVAGETAALEF